MKKHTARAVELIRGRDEVFAGSGLVQLYEAYRDEEGIPDHRQCGEPVRAFNVSTRPILPDAFLVVAEIHDAFWVVNVAD